MGRKRKNDAKLEAFAQELAKGRSAAEAAKAVGYGGSSLVSNAKRRAQNPQVRKRVAELRELAAQNTIVTVERLVDNAEEARLLAMQLEEPSAANQCIRAIEADENKPPPAKHVHNFRIGQKVRFKAAAGWMGKIIEFCSDGRISVGVPMLGRVAPVKGLPHQIEAM